MIWLSRVGPVNIGLPVSDKFRFTRLFMRQLSDQRQMRYLRSGPANLEHSNKRNIVTELCPRSGSRATETANEYERKVEWHHQETYTRQFQAV